MQTGVVDFWWNWDVAVKTDLTSVSPEAAAKAQKTFVPMIWGTKAPGNFSFMTLGSEYVMGFNEPDMYGPACAGEMTYGAFGCGPQEFRAATSAGFASLFDPAKAALQWQRIANQLAAAPEAAAGTVRKLAAPAMAQAAAPVDDCTTDPAQPEALKYCRGWMQVFKAKTLTLECNKIGGGVDNCWDIIEAIPIHAYARTAAEIKQKLHEYHQVFLDDFQGQAGRKQKYLWLTEVTMGTNDAAELTHFVDELMNAKDGLQNREFSQWSLGAFRVGSYTPKQYEAWSSSLFEPTTGHLTPHGEHFVELCRLSSEPASNNAVGSTASSPSSGAAVATRSDGSPPSSRSVSRCAVGDPVDCPGTAKGSSTCAGNQCCPDGSTCPSADESFKGCADVKTEDCTKELSSDARLLLLAAGGHRLFSSAHAEM
eukprot:TRINITY_DN30620_c0_g1_i1.p1 TRINITY_DN30620_c0_g1~~TRINITY_DN30620_c0_g1_i1.p1  ORF type:complete len:500 (-),score=110.33 TRINITY_DN30620_c0_g1_i1:70-1344(-)